MPEPGLVDRQGLLAWANTASARFELPRLIRRLILETTPAIVRVGIPADEGIQSGGWDGTVRSPENIRWVPEGLSLWELSTNIKAAQKANSDYEKRLTTPDGSPTNEASYVALIPRPWTQREEWASRCSEDARWREVRAYGVDDVATWLEAAPATHLWLSERCGLNPLGRATAETWWSNWATRTDPPLTHEFVLAGRGQQADDFVERLAESPSITTISGASLDEVRAFIAAAAVRADATGEGRLLARMVFVNELATWRSLICQQSPLVLVPMCTELADEVPGDCPHQVVVPLARSRADVTVLELDVREGARALQALGIPEENADRLARLARRSLSGLRRSLAGHPELRTPSWAKSPPPTAVRAILLAGHVADERDGDRQVLSDLAGKGYERVRDTLVNLSNPDDPLVCLVDGSWHLVSAEDAWLQLSQYLTPDDLRRLATAADQVLGETDPALELDPRDRWQAPLLGTTRRFSDDLRSGLAETVTLLGARGDEVTGPGGCTGAESAAHLTDNLLRAANTDETGRLWPSLSPLLSLLAEAAPDTFLEAVRQMLQNNSLTEQFLGSGNSDSDLFATTPPRVGLLRALELLACSPEYLGAVTDVLASLAQAAANDTNTNPPRDVLSRIFCVWHPETGATAEQRLEVLDGLRGRRPELAWQLLFSLLPQQGPAQFPLHRPRYRDWQQIEQTITIGEHRTRVHEILDRLIDGADCDVDRWAQLLQPFRDLFQDQQEKIIAGLQTLVQSQPLAPDAQTRLWTSISRFVGIYRPHDGEEDMLPPSVVEKLESLTTSLAPSALERETYRLFSDILPHLAGHSPEDDEDSYYRELERIRIETTAALYRSHGLDAVRRLATEENMAHELGRCLADGAGGEPDTTLIELLSSPGSSSDEILAGNYLLRRFDRRGWEWLIQLVQSPALDNRQRAAFLLGTAEYPKSWEIAGQLGADVRTAYWEQFDPTRGFRLDPSELGVVVDALLQVGRFDASLEVIATSTSRGERAPQTAAQQIAKTLESYLAAYTAEPTTNVTVGFFHDFDESFRLLRDHRLDVGEERVARLEWVFLRALHYNAQVSLHEYITRDPSLFLELLVVREHSASHSASSPSGGTAQVMELASNAYRLLQSWRLLPGQQDDGSVDVEVLCRWINDARALAADSGLLSSVDEYIGSMIVRIPSDLAEHKLSSASMDIIDSIDSAELRAGASSALLRRPGPLPRLPERGGEEERSLAAEYRRHATQAASRWPRTAQVYRSCADHYERLGRAWDNDAERLRHGFQRWGNS